LEENLHKIICAANVENFFEYFKLEPPEDLEASTVSGWIMDVLEKIPEEGDTLTYANLTVTVHKVEGRIVQECLVKLESEHVIPVEA
jgi:CBS domain containing-hemolysin-like protein